MRILILALMLLAPVSAQAESEISKSGWWLDYCSQESVACNAYITGFQHFTNSIQMFALTKLSVEQYETLLEVTKSVLACPPDTVNVGQRKKIWMKYLKNNSDKHHFTPIKTFSLSQREAFPCD